MLALSLYSRRRNVWVFVGLVLCAATFRISVAHWLPNDEPDDGRVYAQIARNVLEQHTYSIETEPPYSPTLIRVPGYPLLIASVYKLFGHGNNGAVRVVQALIDTATCGLVGLLAFYWMPDEDKKRKAAIAAFVLAAVCPFTAIYAATILTEVPATFLLIAMCLAATLAFRAETGRRSFRWWAIAGLLGGLLVLFRPDGGLFVAAVGLTLVITSISRLWSAPAEQGVAPRWPPPSKKHLLSTFAAGLLFSVAFALVLAPWTIRNARVFHLFQPLSPAHGEMPNEFVPRGYNLWLRTWLDDERYIAPFLWSLDTDPITINDVPPEAFDSAEEKDRVVALLEKYNHPPDSPAENTNDTSPQPELKPEPEPTPIPQASAPQVQANSNSTNGKPAPTQPTPPAQSPTNSNVKPAANDNANSDAEDKGDGNDQNDNSSDQGDESDNQNESDQSTAEHGPVEMTPEIDAGFAQIARERIARHPLRFYLILPIKRAHTMWFDTHSQYWPFEGTLLPLDDLDYEGHQQYWLPLFAGLTAAYTLLGLAGGWLLWKSRRFAARRWLLLASLLIFLRLAFFSLLENPEPRYVVEFFPLLAILGGIAIAYTPKLRRPQTDTDLH